ncbi:xanthine dehydrogenase accessory protein XdhC [Paracoccus pacificus]|uniref:Xanthine dehydrogenase accessory protein XdhC n=1 Tax=Paracoccus pacificus TaxID=1463598 RepID=A0ABW4R6J8_9RHOB
MIRIRVTHTKGSTPREAGAEMWVDRDMTRGTIGGGALEYMAIDRARQMLAFGESRATMDVPLGPEIGQCCGGRVALSLEQALPGPDPEQPRVLIFGAGHVGRALALALRPLPVRATLVDSRADELSLAAPGLDARLTPLPEAELRAAPPRSSYVILTHDHALDFLLAAEALQRGDAGYVGMIGSGTKRASFARFARTRGIDPAPLICPIGAGYSRDKRPEVIAAFAAAEIIGRLTSAVSTDLIQENS